MIWVLHLCMLPFNLLVGWPIALLVWLSSGEIRSLRLEHGLIITFEYAEDSLGDDSDYSTTLGYAIAYQPGRRGYSHIIDTGTEYHELIHICQYQDLALRGLLTGLVVALCGNPILGLILWTVAPLTLLTNNLAAVLRGQPLYRGATHERHAYAATELWLMKRDAQAN